MEPKYRATITLPPQPGQPAMVGGPIPVEWRGGRIGFLDPEVLGSASGREQASRLGRLAAEPYGEPGHRRLAGGQGRPETGRLGFSVAGSLGDDRRQLGPDGRDQVAIRAAHAVRRSESLTRSGRRSRHDGGWHRRAQRSG